MADYQPSINDGIFVLVAGTLFIDGNTEAPLRFTHSFLLQKGGEAGYYVHNELFRLSIN